MKQFFATLILIFCTASFCQNTTINATVTDSAGTAWISAPYTIVWGGQGTPSTTSGQSFTLSFSGTTNASGQLSQVVTDVAYIVPANSVWNLCVTSAVSSPATYCVPVPATGATYSATNLISNAVVPPSITGGPLARAYADSEVTATAGNQYYNLTSSSFRCYTTTWGACNSGGTGTVNTANQFSVPYYINSPTGNEVGGNGNFTTDGNGNATLSGTVAAGTLLQGNAGVLPNTAYVNARQTINQLTSGYFTALHAGNDSLTAGFGASSCPVGGVTGTCAYNLLAAKMGLSSWYNWSVGGNYAEDEAINVISTEAPANTDNIARVVGIGTNDAINKGVGPYETNYRNALQGIIAYDSGVSRVTGATVTPASNWSTIAFPQITGLISSTSGAAQVWPYTTTATGQTPCLLYLVADGNLGTENVTDSSGFFGTYNVQNFGAGGTSISTTVNHNGWSLQAACFALSGRPIGSYSLTSTVTSATGVLGGTGYTGTPTATVGTQCGTPATPATVTMTSSGGSASVASFTGGSGGYLCAPAVNISGTGSGAIALATINGSGVVTAVTMYPDHSVINLGVVLSPPTGTPTAPTTFVVGVPYTSCDGYSAGMAAYNADAQAVAGQMYAAGFNVGFLQPRNYWAGLLSQSNTGTCLDPHPNDAGYALFAQALEAASGISSQPQVSPVVNNGFIATPPVTNPISIGKWAFFQNDYVYFQNLKDEPVNEVAQLGLKADQSFVRQINNHSGTMEFNWSYASTAANLFDANSLVRIAVAQGGASQLNSSGTGAVTFNVHASAGTGGVVFGDGTDTVPVASVDNAGNTSINNLAVSNTGTTTALTNGTSWTLTGCTQTTTTALACTTGSGYQVNRPTVNVVAGLKYSITMTIPASCTVAAVLYGTADNYGAVHTTAGTYTDSFAAPWTATGQFGLLITGACNGNITGIGIAVATSGSASIAGALSAGSITNTGCATAGVATTTSGGLYGCSTLAAAGIAPAPLPGTITLTGNTTALACTSGTVSIPNSTTLMVAAASAAGTRDPDLLAPTAYVSANGTVTVEVCTRITDASPPSITYNIRVIQ